MDLRLSGFCVRGVHVFQEHFQHLSEKYKEFRHSLKAVRKDVRIACVCVKDVGGVAGRRAHLSRTYLPFKSQNMSPWVEYRRRNLLFQFEKHHIYDVAPDPNDNPLSPKLQS